LYCAGNYLGSLETCEGVYESVACRSDNLLLLSAIHFQLKNFPEAIFFSQQAIRIDPNCAEAYSNMGNAVKELGDLDAAIQFYLQAVKLKPRFPDAYNNLACCYLQQGLVEDAVDTFQMAILLNPGLIDAHCNLGALLKTQGKLEAAKQCYFEAIRLKSDFSIAWNNLAGVFRDEGALDTAVAYYVEAIRLSPNFADAYSNLGNTFREMRSYDKAIESYKDAIRLRPEFAVAYGNLGACYLDAGNVGEATRCLRHAIQLDPRCPDFFNNLGTAIKASSQSQAAIEEAVQCYRSALRLQPNYPHAYNNLGCALVEVAMMKEALHCFVTAARLAPTLHAAHCNIGTVMAEHRLLAQAVGHFEEALRLSPNAAEVHLNLGNAMKALGRTEDAFVQYQRAAELAPRCGDAFCNIGVLQLEAGLLLDSISSFRAALDCSPSSPAIFANSLDSRAAICDWDGRGRDVSALVSMVRAQLSEDRPATRVSFLAGGSAWRSGQFASRFALPAVQPLNASRYPFTPQELAQIARKYAVKVKSVVAMFATDFKHKAKLKNGRIKVGYVLPDSGNHSIVRVLSSSVLPLHDKGRVDVVCYSLSSHDAALLHADRVEGVQYKDLSGQHFSDAAAAISDDDLNIMVNLCGYTNGATNEIFGMRPAPLQILLGYNGTMGADFIDYIVADAEVLCPESREFFSEAVIYMPHSVFVSDHRRIRGSVADTDRSARSAYGISDDAFVFCNFGEQYKIEPEVFRSWMRILKRVPNSVLWLVRSSTECEANLIDEAATCGVASYRLVFSSIAPGAEQVTCGGLADLFLDTPGVNAHSATCDVLWAGTPVLTVKGLNMTSRVAASLIAAAGLPQLAMSSLSEYEEEAVSLALDAERLFAMRRHLESCRDTCALFDTQRWVKNLESGFFGAWQQYLEQKQQGMKDVTVEDHEPVYIAQDITSIV
jgi:protein O-GlcNAc transferase